MIKYNNANINNFNLGNDNIVKVYKNGAVVFYKMTTSGSTPTFDVCYAVVDDILQYQETEFEDVYDKATEKWYKLNNLNEYEEYGVYGSGRSVTTYNGKLTIDDGYEYEWNGSSWVNVGEVSGSSRVPQGYTEAEYIQNTGTSYINTNFFVNQDTRIVTEMQTVTSTNYGRFIGAGAYNKANAIQFDYETGANGTLHISWGQNTSWSTYSNCTGDYNRHIYDWDKNYFYRDKGESNQFSATTSYTSFSCTDKLGVFCNILNSTAENYMLGKMYSFQIYDNGTLVRDLVPCTRDSDSKAGAYDVVNDVFYVSPNNANFVAGSAITSIVYPLYYTEKSDPLDNLTFSSMTEATEYAYNNCVYNGMKATIAGTIYIFSGDSQSGYEWVENPSRLPSGYTEVEYIENPNRACIDTGFKPNQDTRIVCEMQAVSNSSWGKFFGAGGYDKVGAVLLDYETNPTGTLHLSWGTATGWTIISSVSGDFNKHAYDWNKNEVYRDNTLVHTFTYSNFQSTYNLCIFVNSTGNGTYETNQQHFLIGKLYTFKLYDNGTLVRDLIPCINPNNVVGAYDIVNDVFYSCPRSGYSLVAGPIV